MEWTVVVHSNPSQFWRWCHQNNIDPYLAEKHERIVRIQGYDDVIKAYGIDRDTTKVVVLDQTLPQGIYDELKVMFTQFA